MDAYQFYPTPEATAALMWAKFKRPIGMVCDPSAGRGDLIRYAREGFPGLPDEQLPWMAGQLDDYDDTQRAWMSRELRCKLPRHQQCVAVEIDPRYRAGLSELSCELVGYDFMQVESLATVDQVIMNPPFNAGAAHVLHAWHVVYDAEIVALVNAETVRNPCTAERQRLVQLIKEHGSMEFLQDQFLGPDVERTTSVEVALIYLEKVSGSTLSLEGMLEGLEKGDEALGGRLDIEVARELALPEGWIETVYRHYRVAVEAARLATQYEALAEHAQARLGKSLEVMQAEGVGSEHRDGRSREEAHKTANAEFLRRYRALKRNAWAQILRSTVLNDKLSTQARLKLEGEANHIYELEFSIGNVHGFLSGLLQSMGDIYAAMVCDLFDSITGRSNENVMFYKSWKSNEKHRVGMRIKRTRFILPGFNPQYGERLPYNALSFLQDIDKVFGYLHGISGNYAGVAHAFGAGVVKPGKRISTRFFEFRFYAGSGTVHFYPKDVEVIEKLNRFVGQRRRWLPQSMEEANADFRRQYDEAETFSPLYLKAWSAAGHTSWEWRGALRRSASATTLDAADEGRLQDLVDGVDAVLLAKGLHCGPALTDEAEARKALAYTPEKANEPEAEAQAQAEGQLSLIAA